MEKYNVLLIMADQFATDMIRGISGANVITPNLDALCLAGAAFTNCYTPNPICAPARACLSTGMLGSKMGVYDNASAFPSELPTFAGLMRQGGYRTILSGKMHYIGPDQLHGFEERLTTDIYPSGFNWTPDWTRGIYPNSGTSVKRLTGR